MGLDKGQLSIVGSSFMLVYALASPFAGFAGDRLRRKTLIPRRARPLVRDLLGDGAFDPVLGILVLFRALEGFGEAFYFPASMGNLEQLPRTRHAFARDGDPPVKRVPRHGCRRNAGRRNGGVVQLRVAIGFYLLGPMGVPPPRPSSGCS
jgi:hypothetical protein